MALNKDRSISVLNPPEFNDGGLRQTWTGIYGSADALAIVSAASKAKNPCLVICANARQAETLLTSIHFYASNEPDLPILLFPSWECLPYDNFSPHAEIVSRRIELLYKLLLLPKAIVLVTVENMMQRLPSVKEFFALSFSISVEDQFDLDEFHKRLLDTSYREVEQVEFPGEFALRGGIIDVYAIGSDLPVRIELFDEVVDTLRYFDPISQRSIQKFESLQILPGSEIRTDSVGISSFRKGIRRQFEGDPQNNIIYRSLTEEHVPNGTEYYLPLFYESTSSLFDYLPSTSTIIICEDAEEHTKQFWNEVGDRYELAKNHTGRLPLPPEMLFFQPEELIRCIDERKSIYIRSVGSHLEFNFKTQSPLDAAITGRSSNPYQSLIKHLKIRSGKLLIAVDNQVHMKAIENLLQRTQTYSTSVDSWSDFLNHESTGVFTINANLASGLNLPAEKIAVISNEEIHGRRIQQNLETPRRRVRSPESIISSLDELQIGDPVVHESHGIGRYQGLETLEISGYPAEFLKIKYAGTDTLYVPVYSFDCITRYTSGDENVPLHSLSSKAWKKAKKKAKTKAYDIAAELLEIQSLRDNFIGSQFNLLSDDYEKFTAAFPYQETQDQTNAIDAVLADLQSTKPMDRLICGDVGFGKTEVALRAAYVAASNGCQVAIVTPTTLLAQQHYDVFAERFADEAISIVLLSRLQSNANIKQAVEKLKGGQVDIAIGTHRLLQSDISFKNLGLVVIDEEHRFGVRQKEHLKKLKTGVDVLTLTATPIPRTLSMALNEIRDISIIATPPDSRLSVRTFVREWSPKLIREACMRELARGGQTFYLQNNLRTIRATARNLQKIVPEANIRIAHGQMPKRELEQVMRDFYLQRFDTLVCSTIIESGIDIPSANTIIINQASRFGLAQLHQLRGRVGRSHHQAYAYLLVSDLQGLHNASRKRLDAIESLDQLGVGFVIASHDLEIRGAGALLGDAQSGVMHDVGFSLYSTYLTEAVRNLKRSKLPVPAQTEVSRSFSSEIDLHFPALLPESWIPNVNTRLSLYKRIATAENYSVLNDLRSEIQDRFGALPPDAEGLFEVTKLKLKSTKLGIQKLSVGQNSGYIRFGSNAKFNIGGLVDLIESYPGQVRLNQIESAILLSHNLNSVEDRVTSVNHVLDAITPN